MNNQVLQKQFEHLVSQSKSGITGQILLIILVGLLLASDSSFPQTLLWGWIGLAMLTQVFRLVAFIQFQKLSKLSEIVDITPWKRRYVIHVLINGLLWAVLFALVFYLMPTQYHYIMMAIGLGLSGAAVVTLGAVYKVYAAFTAPMLFTLMLLMLFSSSQQEFISGMVLALGLAYLLITGNKYAQNLANIFEQQIAIKSAQIETLQLLGRAGEFKDSDTGDHVKRVGSYAYQLALNSGLSEQKARMIELAGTLHDIGKVAIPDRVLLKPSKLDSEEWNIMQSHAIEGGKILENAHAPLLKMAKLIAETHHEKWDGSGYPHGLKAEEIPIEGRILAICDVYDALNSERPYKKAWPKEKVIDYLKSESGQHFDPKLVKLFIALLEKQKSSSTDDELTGSNKVVLV